jgi:hypothetical protein
VHPRPSSPRGGAPPVTQGGDAPTTSGASQQPPPTLEAHQRQASLGTSSTLLPTPIKRSQSQQVPTQLVHARSRSRSTEGQLYAMVCFLLCACVLPHI